MIYSYPQAATVFEIASELSTQAEADRPELKLFPNLYSPTLDVRWTQRDNPSGLMAMRGVGGEPPRIPTYGATTYVWKAGVYGEYDAVEEDELLTRADTRDPTKLVDSSEMVMERFRRMAQRKADRKSYNVFSLLLNGRVTGVLAGSNGQVIYNDTYPIQRFFASVPWANTSTATPLADMQKMAQLAVGHGGRFDYGSEFWINQISAYNVVNNTNPNDIGGKKAPGGANLGNLALINQYFAGQNLPKFVVKDDGFQPAPNVGPITSGQYQKWINNNQGILIGARNNGDPLGNFIQTYQAIQARNAPGVGVGQGEYAFVKDFASGVNASVNVAPRMETHMGFNGGIAMYYPSLSISASI